MKTENLDYQIRCHNIQILPTTQPEILTNIKLSSFKKKIIILVNKRLVIYKKEKGYKKYKLGRLIQTIIKMHSTKNLPKTLPSEKGKRYSRIQHFIRKL